MITYLYIKVLKFVSKSNCSPMKVSIVIFYFLAIPSSLLISYYHQATYQFLYIWSQNLTIPFKTASATDDKACWSKIPVQTASAGTLFSWPQCTSYLLLNRLGHLYSSPTHENRFQRYLHRGIFRGFYRSNPRFFKEYWSKKFYKLVWR